MSCSDDNIDPLQTTEVNFTEIAKGDLGGSGIPESNLVITNPNDWQNFIEQLDNTSDFNDVSETFTEINIDFDSYMVIAKILETKTSGWNLDISNITETSTEILVETQSSGTLLTVISQPFHIVKIPLNSKPVVFE